MRAGKSPGKKGGHRIDSMYPPEPEKKAGFLCKRDLVPFFQVTSHLLPNWKGRLSRKKTYNKLFIELLTFAKHLHKEPYINDLI